MILFRNPGITPLLHVGTMTHEIIQAAESVCWQILIDDQTNHTSLHTSGFISFSSVLFTQLQEFMITSSCRPFCCWTWACLPWCWDLFANCHSIWRTTPPGWMLSEELRSMFYTQCTSCCFPQILSQDIHCLVYHILRLTHLLTSWLLFPFD